MQAKHLYIGQNIGIMGDEGCPCTGRRRRRGREEREAVEEIITSAEDPATTHPRDVQLRHLCVHAARWQSRWGWLWTLEKNGSPS